MPRSLEEQVRMYKTIAQAIGFIRENARHQPTLAEIAASVNLSEFHLQRIFSEWVGISPKRFLQFLSKEYAKHALKASMDVLTVSQESGLSGSGRLHDLMVTCEAMSPGEIKSKGKGVTVTYGVAATPFGKALVAWTGRGICNLLFCDQDCENKEQELYSEWSAATLVRDDVAASGYTRRIFSVTPQRGKLHLVLRGTNFQIKVWEALLKIGSGRIVSYSTLAQMTGSPKAQRAVGTAMASNRIGFLIPCHRVIRENGEAGIYHWGSERKIAMMAWEAVKEMQEK